MPLPRRFKEEAFDWLQKLADCTTKIIAQFRQVVGGSLTLPYMGVEPYHKRKAVTIDSSPLLRLKSYSRGEG